MSLLLPLIVIAVVWNFVARGERFLPGIAGLLSGSEIHRRATSLLSGRSSATGRFNDRDVTIQLHLKRKRYGYGYLVVAFRTGGPPTLGHADIEERVQNEAGRRALHSLATHDLLPSVEEGWLQVTWRPRGFVIFPGRYAEEKWRQVFEAMGTLATSLEAAA
jgi:hypothetical protein